jgi:hypothetical protein
MPFDPKPWRPISRGAGRLASYPGGTWTVTGRSPPTTILAASDAVGVAVAGVVVAAADGVRAGGAEAGTALAVEPPEHATSNAVHSPISARDRPKEDGIVI